MSDLDMLCLFRGIMCAKSDGFWGDLFIFSSFLINLMIASSYTCNLVLVNYNEACD